MRKGTKRKTKHTEEPKPDAAAATETATATASEENKNKATEAAPSRPKRAKTSKPQSEPEYFEDKRNLVSTNTILSSYFHFFFV